MGVVLGEHSRQYCGSGAQDAGPRGGFDRFQIRPPFSLSSENYLEERLDLARNFLMNGNSVFFSSSVQPAAGCSVGRRRQICSLIAVSSAVRV
jgi:hypothetical protein